MAAGKLKEATSEILEKIQDRFGIVREPPPPPLTITHAEKRSYWLDRGKAALTDAGTRRYYAIAALIYALAQLYQVVRP